MTDGKQRLHVFSEAHFGYEGDSHCYVFSVDSVDDIAPAYKKSDDYEQNGDAYWINLVVMVLDSDNNLEIKYDIEFGDDTCADDFIEVIKQDEQ